MGNDPFNDRLKVPKHGQKAEKHTSRRLGGKARAGSGSIEGFKGDIELSAFLVENKSTEHKSIALKYDWLSKISREAICEGRDPALAIQFVDKFGHPIAKDATWVMVPERVFKEIIDDYY